MDIDALYGLNNLKTLRLDRCLLLFMPPVGHVKDTLQTLMVTENLITHIPNGYFDDLPQLITISLSNNYLTLFPDVSPVRHTLVTLSISSNYIPEIPHFMFDNAFISLKHLMIGDNIIHSLPSNFLSNFSSLQYFVTINNNLHTLDKTVFGGQHVAVVVALFGNPWRCDSALSWLCELHFENYSFMGLVQQFKTYEHVGITDYKRLVCAGPSIYAGMDIMHLSTFQSN